MRAHGTLRTAGKLLTAAMVGVGAAAAAWLVVGAYRSPALVASLALLSSFCR